MEEGLTWKARSSVEDALKVMEQRALDKLHCQLKHYSSPKVSEAREFTDKILMSELSNIKSSNLDLCTLLEFSEIYQKLQQLNDSSLVVGEAHDTGFAAGFEAAVCVFCRREELILEFLSDLNSKKSESAQIDAQHIQKNLADQRDAALIEVNTFREKCTEMSTRLADISSQRDAALIEVNTFREKATEMNTRLANVSSQRDAALNKLHTISEQTQREAAKQARDHERIETELRSSLANRTRNDAKRIASERTRLSKEITRVTNELNTEHARAMDRALRAQARRHERALAAALQARDDAFKKQLEARRKRDSELAKTLKLLLASTEKKHKHDLESAVAELDQLCHDVLTSIGRSTHPPLSLASRVVPDSNKNDDDYAENPPRKPPRKFLRRGEGERRRELLASRTRERGRRDIITNVNVNSDNEIYQSDSRGTVSLRTDSLCSPSSEDNDDPLSFLTPLNNLVLNN
uniref:Uncharacterized protein n=2 Tax=Aureoumbra lagunensis TaxID=44058 RepID=A0A7S3JVL8_9STRA